MMREKAKKDFVFLIVMLVLAFIMRFDFVHASHYVIDSDEAIVGLMAGHILHGSDVPTFYYGQHYMGSLEAILVAAFFKFFGISNLGLKLVPIAFSLVLVLLIYSITLEIWNKSAARISAMFAAISPAAHIIWSAKARGGFIEILVIGAMSLLLMTRWLKEKKFSLVPVGLTGLLLGIGWWVNNQIIYFMIPVAYAVVSAVIWGLPGDYYIKLRKLTILGFTGILSFLIGSIPFWIYNIRHSFVSFGMFRRSGFREIIEHTTGFFSTSLPILLGGKHFWEKQDYLSGSSLLVYVIYGSLFLCLLAGRYRELLALFKFKLDYAKPVELYVIFLICCFVIFVSSSFGYLVEAPRYLLPMYVGIFPLAAIAVDVSWQRIRVMGVILLLSIVALNIFSCYPGKRAIPGEPFVYGGERVSRDHEDLIKWLTEKDYSWVRTNYWIGYKLAFETGEKVRFVLFQEPSEARIKSYEEDGRRYGIERMPYVLVPAQAHIVKRALQRLGYDFKEKELSGYAVIFDIKGPYIDLVPASIVLKAEASVNSEVANLGVDGNEKTRWGSAKPQAPGMEFKVKFDEQKLIRGFAYCFGDWTHDYPRGLQIVSKKSDGSSEVLLSSDDYVAIRYVQLADKYCGNGFVVYMKPTSSLELDFIQTDSHPILDWSIAEIRIFQ